LASFIYNPAAPITAGQTEVTFNASSSQDPDGSISQYVWDFGDGSPVATLGTASTTHVFVDSPITCDFVVYTVQLTVIDDQGAESSAADQVEVLELPDPRVVQCVPGS
jgi:serine protease